MASASVPVSRSLSFSQWFTVTYETNKPFSPHIGFGQCFILGSQSKLGLGEDHMG